MVGPLGANGINEQRVQIHGPGESWSRANWDAYVQSRGDASPYHASAFRSLIEDVFHHPTFYLSATDPKNKITGVLPLARLRSRLFGDFMVSMPYFNYGGALSDDPGISEALMLQAASLARELGVSHVEFRDTAPRDSRWPVRTDKVVMLLPLPDSDELLWKQLGPKIRAQVRRPRKDGRAIEVERGGLELMPDFYHVFATNMRDLGTPVYSRRLFDEILRRLPEESHVLVVRVAGHPAAAAFLLQGPQRMEIPWASSLRTYNRIGVNMLLYWEALKFSIARGCRVFDFGRSSIGSSTHRFKQQWGAQPRQLYWHYWLRTGNQPPALNPDNPRFRLAVRMWQRLPLAIANRLGPPIVRNLP
jgi:serine/alanine adding enzyme